MDGSCCFYFIFYDPLVKNSAPNLLEMNYKRMLPQGFKQSMLYDHTLPQLQHLAPITTTLYTFVWVQPPSSV